MRISCNAVVFKTTCHSVNVMLNCISLLRMKSNEVLGHLLT